MSLLSVLQKRHQTLPSAEIGGAPEPGEAGDLRWRASPAKIWVFPWLNP